MNQESMKANVIGQEKSTKGISYNQAEGGWKEGERKKYYYQKGKEMFLKIYKEYKEQLRAHKFNN